MDRRARRQPAHHAIDETQIADIVSVTSGVPVSSLTESESRRLLQAECGARRRALIGQDEACRGGCQGRAAAAARRS
ncbi:MAG: hypothetical protein ACLU7D_04730 [Collinsella sp.]